MLTGRIPYTGSTPFAIMNDRLLNSPMPPREANPEISPQLQEILYRALERDPQKRYRSAYDFALDLEHPDKVGILERAEETKWHKRRSPLGRKIIFYSVLMLIPVVLLFLMLYVARHS